MAEGKTNQELLMELQLKKLLMEEREARYKARNIVKSNNAFTFNKEDLVKGIILREILGPPKSSEG